MYTIYKIEKDGKIFYIGKTVDFKRRKWEHTYRRKLDKSYKFEIIESNLSAEDAKKREEYYINLYDTFKNGWNRTCGEGTKGVPNKKNDSRFKKGNKMYLKRQTKRVLHIDTNTEYESARECGEALGFPPDKINSACNGTRKSYKKNRFRYI